MSFDPSKLPQQRFRNLLNYQTVALFEKPAQSARFVPLKFDWSVYFAVSAQPVIAVPIDLQGGQLQGGLLDRIRSIKIDNTQSTIAISVWFPDTGDMITCPPETVVTLPVMTNGLKCSVIAQGLTTGFTPLTMIYLTNYFLPTSIDPQQQLVFPQWIGSPTQQRSNLLTPGFGPPALGDQVQSQSLLYDGSPHPLFGTPRASGIIIMTGFSLQMIIVGPNQPTLQVFGATYGNIYNFSAGAPLAALPITIPMVSKSGMNLRFDATDSFNIQGQGDTGNYSYQLEYCYQP